MRFMGDGLPSRSMMSETGLPAVVLQVGEQRGDGVQLEAVDGDDLVAGLEAGAGGGHVLVASESDDLDGVSCILGMRPSLSSEKSSGPPLYSTKMLVSMRWPSWT